MLPLKNVDLVIVAIGENFGASIKTVALLRKLGVRRLYARAIDELHRDILEGMRVERIITPEQRAAHDLVNELALGTKVESLRVDRDNFIIRFSTPDYFLSMTYSDLADPDKMFGLKLVAASRPEKSVNTLGIDATRLQTLDLSDTSLTVSPGDILTCLGTPKSYAILCRHMQK